MNKPNPDPPCTQAQREAIVAAAQGRVNYLRWLAAKQMTCGDEYLRRQVAEVLLQFVEGCS